MHFNAIGNVIKNFNKEHTIKDNAKIHKLTIINIQNIYKSN